MKQFSYIFILISALILTACSEDTDASLSEMHVCVRCAWHDGLERSLTKATMSNNGTSLTRAISDIILSGNAGADIVIPIADYPSDISVTDDGDVSFNLLKGSSPCSEHSGYYTYTSSPFVPLSTIEGKTLSATAAIDGETMRGTTHVGQEPHLQLDLLHTKALLRFAFKVAEKYDQIRLIKITDIKLNGADCTLADKVLNKTNMQFIAYGYIDPTVVSISSDNTLKCKYNVYDKDGVTPEHLVRTDEASNTFKLASTSITSLQEGYYYDLNVTLDPDSLHVLSDHDNQHLTIN